MDLIQIAQKNTEAYNRHDIGNLYTCYTEDATYDSPRTGRNLRGDGIVKYVKSVWEAYPDAKVELITMREAGEGLIVSEWRFSGTNTGILPNGSPATGRTVTFQGASFTQYKGDQIQSERVYFDLLDVLTQLGLKP
jgi:steroid delta-isomerase-like uncharacterized protein